MTRARRITLIAVGASLAVAALFAVVVGLWIDSTLPQLVARTQAALDARTPARVYTDRAGRVLHMRPGYDHEWRYPIPLDEVPQRLVQITLAAEDYHFYEHTGVDFSASLRAFGQLVRNRRIISGSSTITMQLMNMADYRRRSWFNKIRQMLLARAWERCHTKRQILQDYFNFLPYGGKVYGVEAAARYYFGRNARDLNLAECALLAGIPQSPNRFRPDRHPEAAKRRQRIVLKLMVRRGILSEQEAADAYRTMPLRYRDFNVPLRVMAKDPQFFVWLESPDAPVAHTVASLADHPTNTTIAVTLNPEFNENVRAILARTTAAHPSVHDAGAVIFENRTGALRALVGTLDFEELPDGQVNVTLSQRSPGSALKPFIYGEAIDGGAIVGETILEDKPLLYEGYRPGNYDGTFRGPVRAETALADSLNTPAIRLLQQMGVKRVWRTLARASVWTRDTTPDDKKFGLSLALGSKEVSLLNLANAYRIIACKGQVTPYRMLESELAVPPGESATLWSTGACEMVSAMLRSHAMPNAQDMAIAWKTGTSNGNRDAWCVGYTPEWTVGVWFGNKSGAPSPDLVGGSLAAGVVGSLMRTLYRDVAPPEWRDVELEVMPLCRRSGLRPGTSCATTFPGKVVKGIPLRICADCSRSERRQAQRKTMIVTPVSGDYQVKPGETNVCFRLECNPPEVHVYQNNRYLGIRRVGSVLNLSPGEHTFLFWGGADFSTTQQHITVSH